MGMQNLSGGVRISTDDYERRIAAQIRSLRIRNNLDQATLADVANVSLGTIQNLERGKGSSLSTLIKVVRALEQEDWLERLDPFQGSGPSPMQQLRAERRAPTERPRVRRSS